MYPVRPSHSTESFSRLRRGQALHNVLAHAALGNGFDEILNDLVTDVPFPDASIRMHSRIDIVVLLGTALDTICIPCER